MSDVINDTERVRRMVEKDSCGAINSVMSVVQSDVTTVLGEFMHVESISFSVNNDGGGSGKFIIGMEVVADRFYDIGKTTG